MSADLVLCAAPTDPEWRERYDRYLGSADGSGYDGWAAARAAAGIDGLPWMWIGQVSYLKAGLTEDDAYMPAPMREVARLMSEPRILTPGVAKMLTVAMNLPNRSVYGRREVRCVPYEQGDPSGTRVRPLGNRLFLYRKPPRDNLYVGIAHRQDVKRWLAAHMGSLLIAEVW